LENLYSLVVHPPEEILLLVQSMKEQLASEIGWYNSKNSVGHITICEFKATETILQSIKKQISQLCNPLVPVSISMDNFGSFANGAFFIAPDNDSKINLKRIMKQFNTSLQIRDMKKSDNPHLTIARRLPPENLIKANQLFTAIHIQFICDSVVLRQFDQNAKQFFALETFAFGNNPQPQTVQGTLF
jgi:2'-5' RNA ligase